MIAAEGHAYRRFWIVLTPNKAYAPCESKLEPVSGPRPLPESNESVKAIRAIETRLREAKETP